MGTEGEMEMEVRVNQQHLCLGVVVKAKKWLKFKYSHVRLNLREPMHQCGPGLKDNSIIMQS